MGLLFVQRLEGDGVFKCRRCRVDAASKDAIISRDFYGRSGRAYLFDHSVVPQEKAYDASQKYKEGKFILERARMWKDS
ncbi:putative yippee-like protein Os10g0369500 [Oryza brachyantha]|uniref:putative yippee-like protein Os10g0369500 n=1 Tax=Oryza brachyantha TaxID=4533 RepID=UPI00077646CA|nr:putative yippee-like protein Os10g0369500 [Oryza brachyantha]